MSLPLEIRYQIYQLNEEGRRAYDALRKIDERLKQVVEPFVWNPNACDAQENCEEILSLISAIWEPEARKIALQQYLFIQESN